MLFTHGGKSGDIIYSLAYCKDYGPGRFMICHGWTRARGATAYTPATYMTPDRIANIRPLLECQPYLTAVETSDSRPDGAIELDAYYKLGKNGTNIQEYTYNCFGRPLPDIAQPWLTVPEPKKVARVVFHRSGRNRDSQANWNVLVSQYKAEAVFIRQEADDQRFPDMPRVRCANLYEMAQIIAGAELFIGNQSCPLAIAEGLKKKVIVEYCYSRLDATFVRPGVVAMPRRRTRWVT